MYEFVETPKGWRLFWGVDPHGNEPRGNADGTREEAKSEPVVLPFIRPDDEPTDRPAA